MSAKLSLNKEWTLGERIGAGGFGQVFAATSADGVGAVAKMVPKEPGAQRELLFVNLGDARNVVPIIDSGATDDFWVMVMPRAEKSLRGHLDGVAGPIEVPDSVGILSDIVVALVDLEGKVVHRDVKPANILLLHGRWCLADFGISRYAEASTAPDTHKYALSAPYAAPERWRGERATTATDVYSLGVIAYELLSGSLPFPGPDFPDFRDQHLHGAPANLARAPTALAALIEECMYKAPDARPKPANLMARLSGFQAVGKSKGLTKLQEANRAEIARRSEVERRQSEHHSESERRTDLADSAVKGLKRIGDALKEAIVEAAPAASLSEGRSGRWVIRLNDAQLEFTAVDSAPQDAWGSWHAPAFDVVAHSSLSLRIPTDRQGYEGRSHSLWYCDAKEQGQFQWFETAFMVSPLISRRGRQNPFALSPSEEAAKALWVGMAEFQAAWPFTPLSVADLEEFIDRWGGWFGKAAQGKLSHPSMMPERSPDGSWRSK